MMQSNSSNELGEQIDVYGETHSRDDNTFNGLMQAASVKHQEALDAGLKPPTESPYDICEQHYIMCLQHLAVEDLGIPGEVRSEEQRQQLASLNVTELLKITPHRCISSSPGSWKN